MNFFILLLTMIFCHIIDDFYLQGILASMKQKKWWEEKNPGSLYRNDYLCALCAHSFSWTFMIMLPLLVYFSFNPNWIWFFLFIINFFVHALVDNLKANKLVINLWTDQMIHITQIIITTCTCIYC